MSGKGSDPPGGLADIAGSYECGSDFSHGTIRIEADGRYEETFAECLGDHEARGTAELIDGCLVLRRLSSSRWYGPDRPLVPIGWGDRRYLVSIDQMPVFCYDVYSFIEPRYGAKGSYYLRSGDHRIRAVGWPRVPGPFIPLLRRQPVRGSVLEDLGEGKASVDLGADDGILAGMRLRVRDKPHLLATVEAVERWRCRVAVEGSRRGQSSIAPGQVITCDMGDRKGPAVRVEDPGVPPKSPLMLVMIRPDWKEAVTAGEYVGPEGTLRLLTPDRVAGLRWQVLPRRRGELVLLHIDPDLVRSPIRWEVDPASGELWPILQGYLNVDAVVKATPFR